LKVTKRETSLIGSVWGLKERAIGDARKHCAEMGKSFQATGIKIGRGGLDHGHRVVYH
jgi:hypothetical protein